ncbi:MAG: NADH-quinone oxidoreductase subunit NuoH [Anaerolineae bacterium]
MRNFLAFIGGWIYRLIPLIALTAVVVLFLVFGLLRLEWVDFGDFSPIAEILTAFVLLFIGLLPIVFLSWGERKVVGRIQNRIGPNTAGPWGIIVGLADAVKMFTKEDTTPAKADHFLFNLAPVLMGAAAFAVFGVIPFAPGLIGADLSVAVLYLLALGSVTSIAVLTAGWASNNKYALLGAFRTVSQLISYEIPQALALLTPIMLAGTMSTVGLVEAQDVAYIFALPVSAFIFFVASIAETARSPFDILEADSEIVAGFNIEYGGIKFALFFLAEYANMFAVSMLTTILFLGGYRLFGLEETLPFLAPVIIIAKSLALVFLFMWIRGTVPRLRLDQLLALNWKFMVPLSLVNIIVVAIVAKLVEDSSTGVQTIVLLAANVLMILGAGVALKIVGQRARQREEMLLAAVTDAPQMASLH